MLIGKKVIIRDIWDYACTIFAVIDLNKKIIIVLKIIKEIINFQNNLDLLAILLEEFTVNDIDPTKGRIKLKKVTGQSLSGQKIILIDGSFSQKGLKCFYQKTGHHISVE